MSYLESTYRSFAIALVIVATFFVVKDITIPVYKELLSAPVSPYVVADFEPLRTTTTFTPAHPTSTTHYGESIDTIGRGDTVYFYPTHYSENTIEVLVTADSLSGSTGATVFYETSLKGLVWRDRQYGWHRKYFNGPGMQDFGVTDTKWPSEKWRVKVVAAESTQSTRVSFKYRD